MMEGDISERRKKDKDSSSTDQFTDTLFSWSLEDISNENLYTEKMEKIPESFQSVEHYLGSYVYPLLEETRAQVYSSMEILYRAPFAEVVSFEETKPYGTKVYQVRVDHWKNRFYDRSKEPYRTLPGDLLLLANAKPETFSDLERTGRSWAFLSVTKITENDDDSTSTYFKVEASREFIEMQTSMFVVFLVNVTPHRRIWKSLHMSRNLKILDNVLCIGSEVKKNCDCLSIQSESTLDNKMLMSLFSNLNESQACAVTACLHMINCKNKSAFELIWGPPGTGKTKTTATLLVALLRMKCRTVICAPTNVAITEVASRVRKMVFDEDAEAEALLCSFGDILLFGNKDRLKVGSEIQEIYLDYRVLRLAECLGPLGWNHSFTSMINFLEDCVSQYHIFLENELIKDREQSSECDMKEKKGCREKFVSFLDYVRQRFVSIVKPLRKNISVFCTHIPKSYILDQNFKNMVSLSRLLDFLETFLFQDNMVSEGLEEVFSCAELIEDPSDSFGDKSSLLSVKSDCLFLLRTLHGSLKGLDLPSSRNVESIQKFCFEGASIIFCTASSSYKLHGAGIKALNFLVIDEAAQLKECELIVPLQLPSIKHVVLVGDECQLPATLTSKVSEDAGFGRSLFERLSSQNYSKRLLNMQYRMHPSISSFPNSKFYNNQIQDAPIVKRRSYEKNYLPGMMFGSYSFLNVIGGREEKDDDGRSRRNMVEVAIVLKLLQNLYKAWLDSQEELSIGVVTPYTAQVVAIQEKLGKQYDQVEGFKVKVKTVDGFQGGEEDIIVMSTVRSNSGQSLDFISNPQRMNVALTRARHCLWILGNARTLASESLWAALVADAKNRGRFYSADDDKGFAKLILEVKKELDQYDDLLNADSILFKSSKWKVHFSENFLKSFKKLRSVRTKKSVLNLLLKLSTGWRPKRPIFASADGSPLEILKVKVEGLYVVLSIDIVKDIQYVQILKIWDILAPDDIPKLIKRLDSIFGKYTDDFINLCNEKYLEGNLEIPKSWPPSLDIIRFKDLSIPETCSDLVDVASDGRSYVENSRVSESFLLMKFYSLSYGIVNHLLTDRDGRELDLPFQVTDQEMEIILFPRSSFILGRSGTGKTTVLTMKLFQKEKLYHMAMKGYCGANNNELGHVNQNSVDKKSTTETREAVLRQLFVTVSPKLCFAIKQHVSHLKSFACGDSNSDESSSTDHTDAIDDEESQFKNIPDSFLDIAPNSYPLVVTFHKFLMMLDGTLGNSYFERFIGVGNLAQSQTRSSRSVVLQTFLSTKEVNYEKFSISYWPQFNSKLTTKLDPSRVFTEIISYIKGGPQAMEASEFKLSREDYVMLSEARSSHLSGGKRERIYDIYQSYEKMKKENGEFDVADFVIDLHRRLRHERYEGDQMDFVYIDEVQDLTMSQIALFKNICCNVEEGYVFSGDTAQTIARGIDFRFQDIRSLFYKRFLLDCKSGHEERREKGIVSGIFSLTQNFRTHDGILKLSQSIIELLYHFFPQSIDILKPETSLIYGEAPILLQSENSDNSIVKIFKNNIRGSENFVGFGAEQVILVRDENARQEIEGVVGKQALLLTILECKGLEFQDVLLYNFFGSSPLRNEWRVIYEYMKEANLFDSSSPSCPKFSEAKHNILCSELKQLYVAVTRTRQRLWICENTELAEPMFEYWKKKCLVQVRQLDDSLAQAMQVASSPEEWKSRGIKLFYEKNYEWATMCFERAHDKYWESMSKASGLKAMADHMRTSKPEEANSILREAAEIFEGIGKADFAARCFSDLGMFKRAGKIYLEKLRDPGKAAECFTLAGCYEIAADVYARGNFFSECLDVCSKGKLFDMGLEYIRNWKQHTTRECGILKRSIELDKIEQVFLEKCAYHYHELKDSRSMLKFVRAFISINSIRNFLRPLGCFNELILLEEESGNFMEAANIAKEKGDILLLADLLEKAGKFKEAANLILFYVLVNSLWSSGSRGWPLKKFRQKDELLTKAKSFAKNEGDDFYEFVCLEADIMAAEESDLVVMMNRMITSQKHKSVRGEIISARKILHTHLSSEPAKYFLEEELVFDLMMHSEDLISKNQVSVESLVYFWNFWKDKIVKIFEYIGCLETQDVNEFRNYGECCLNFLGVWRQFHNFNSVYLLVNSEADWAKGVEKRYFHSNRLLASIDVRQLVSASQTFWSSEVLSVGIMVLHKLKALHDFQVQGSDMLICKSRILTLIYEVASFLLESKYLEHSYQHSETLLKFVRLAADNFVRYIFPSDWRESLRSDMVFFRRSDMSKSLLKRFVVESISSRKRLSYGQIGTVLMVILGSGIIDKELYGMIREGLNWNLPWKSFLESLYRTMGTDILEGFGSGNVAEVLENVECPEVSEAKVSGERTSMVHLIWSFHEALADADYANWSGQRDCISPGCFFYLVEHLLLQAASVQGFIITSKSLFVEWLMYQGESTKTNSSYNMVPGLQQSLERIRESVIDLVKQFLNNRRHMAEWKQTWSMSVKEHNLLVFRLILMICLLHANFGNCSGLLFHFLQREEISEQLPWEFCCTLNSGRNRHFQTVLAEALKKIDNPLVIVKLGEYCPAASSNSNAVVVDMTVNHCKDEILRALFPKVDSSSEGYIGVAAVEDVDSCRGMLSTIDSDTAKSSEMLPCANPELVIYQDRNTEEANVSNNLPMDFCGFWEDLEAINSLNIGSEQERFISDAQTIKGNMERYIQVMTGDIQKPHSSSIDEMNQISTLVDELKQLCAALDASELEPHSKLSSVKELSKRVQSRRPVWEAVLNQLSGEQIADTDDIAVETLVASDG